MRKRKMEKRKMSKRKMKREIIVSLSDLMNRLGSRRFNYMPLYIFNGRDGRKEKKRMKEKEIK